jgi:hypothetical protein
MPSVRVKRFPYATIADPSSPSAEPRSLATIFAPFTTSTAPDTAITHAAPQPSPTIGFVPESLPRPQNRPRASSRVDRHCQSLRLGRVPSRGHQDFFRQSPDLQRLPSNTPLHDQGVTVFEGRGVNFSVPSIHEGEPGFVGSALSLPPSQPADDHHHDDVVEHLECIGSSSTPPAIH